MRTASPRLSALLPCLFTLLSGCSPAGSSFTDPAGDAGPDATADSGPALTPLEACDSERHCRHFVDLYDGPRIEFPPALDPSRPELGQALVVNGIGFIAWGDSFVGKLSAGVGRTDLTPDTFNMDRYGGLVAFGPVEMEQGHTHPAALFVHGDGLAVLDPLSDFSRAAILELEADGWRVGESLPVAIESTARPGVVGVGRAVAALIGPPARFVLLDQSFSERLVDDVLEEETQGYRMYGATLTRTCAGLVATWMGRELHAAAFDLSGQRRSPIVTLPDISYLSNAVWDGRHVLVHGRNRILALDINAQLVSETPAPPGDAIYGAVGSDDGLLVFLRRNGSYRDDLVLLEPGTGRVLQELGPTDMTGPYSLTTTPNRVHAFADGTLGLDWARVSCEK